MANRKASSKLGAIIRRDGPYCSLCGFYVVGKSRTVDHILEVRNEGKDDMDNLRMAHQCCNQARDSHYTLDVNMTLEYLEALKELTTRLNELALPWRFLNVPDKERRDFEVQVKANPADIGKVSNLVNIISNVMNRNWGSFSNITVVPDETTPTKVLPLVEVAEFYPSDALRKGIEKMNVKNGRPGEFQTAIRHMLWTYLNQNEHDIYRQISRSDMFRDAEGNLIQLAEINS